MVTYDDGSMDQYEVDVTRIAYLLRVLIDEEPILKGAVPALESID